METVSALAHADMVLGWMAAVTVAYSLLLLSFNGQISCAEYRQEQPPDSKHFLLPGLLYQYFCVPESAFHASEPA